VPFNGAGMFVRLRNWVEDATAGVKIRADYHDIEDDNFAGGISQCIARDGQSTITNNIPMNSKRMVSLSDPVDPQDSATKAYADTKLPLAGGTITGDLTVNGNISSLRGYQTRTGLSGSLTGNVFNFNWTGSLEAWINNSNIGALATQAYVENRAQAWAAQYAAPKVNRAGDTMSGALTLPYAIATSNVYYFGPSAAGYIIWNGGGSYSLGGGGGIWHTGNLPNPVTNARLTDAGGGTNTYTGPSGSIVSVLVPISSGPYANLVNGAYFRYLQLYNSAAGVWFTVGYG